MAAPLAEPESRDVRALAVEAGEPHPLGVTCGPDGVNFCLYSSAATAVTLLLFDSETAREPARTIRFDPYRNKTFHLWHVFLRGCRPGTCYAFRVDGPDAPAEGHRFDPEKVLISPYARGVSRRLWRREDAIGRGDNMASSMRCVVVDTGAYDWEGDRPLERPMHQSIIYELHVGGFTRSPSSGVRHPGTYAGLIEKVPYLQALGVTAVELLPVFEFDDRSTWPGPSGEPLRNFWGYSPVAFFSPHSGYGTSGEAAAVVNEFRDLVKALHRAGIEVILDVVFSHTEEGTETGPTFGFRGIDNRTFYLLDPSNPARYLNYSGVGNTINANHPLTQKLIVDCLRYWVEQMHVDGFRFDEGSILARGEDGAPLEHPPVIWQIELDDALVHTKVIAEAWDAAGLSQVGHFPGDRWAEWNACYRDDVRRFVRGDAGMIGAVASRLGASADIYHERGETPENSINFVTIHDGFTLHDLVSYDRKHNEANGEGNRDGIDQNFNWNCGVEGPTDDPAIVALRRRQTRNVLAILLLSRGVPMLLGGDEIGRTQGGNNNPYNQDNPTSWVDWTRLDANRDLFRFVQRLIAFRKAHPALWQPRFYTGTLDARGMPDIAWHGTQLERPGFDDPDARALACTIAGVEGSPDLHVMMNMYWEALTFEVPAPGGWRLAIDTSAEPPGDAPGDTPGGPAAVAAWVVPGRTIVVLERAR